jgi:hypothetical protein
MADKEPSLKRKGKYITSFSNVSQEEAEVILGFEFGEFYDCQIPIEQFITTTAPEELKKKIFERLIDCTGSEGFPDAVFSPMDEAVVTDHVGMILITMVYYCKFTMNRGGLKLLREKQINSEDEEFVIIQNINVGNTRYVIVIEAKCDSFGTGFVQLLLSLKSMWEINNDQKLVYGFITTAIDWHLVIYDGQTWKLSERSTVLIPNMRNREDQWFENNTQMLDVIYGILLSI